MACPGTWLITIDYWKSCIRSVKAAIVGLEKLSDADVATYLNDHAVVTWTGMPTIWTAAMVHEARTALI